jgi:glycosyltransferase involved in cell wall biosynthesis
MDFKNKRIGYWPYKPDLDTPGDRRRFVFYADERKIPFKIASVNEAYDIVYLTMGCNISQWLAYKKKCPGVKMVFEIIDSYFLEGLNFYSALRGVVRFLSGKESSLYLNYSKAVNKMLGVADAVVCSTPIQKEYILAYNKNVHISLDYFLNDITHFKTDYGVNKKAKIVWEGQSYTAYNLLHVNKVFQQLAGKVELHVITDPIIKYPFKIFNKSTAKVLSSLQCPYYIHEWKQEDFSKIISQMDLAIIPLSNNKHQLLTINKPENKLLLLWQIGIPVITSVSPAYKRVMDKAGLDMYCLNGGDEWLKKITNFIDQNEANRKALALKASAYAQQFHTREQIIKKWDSIFESLYQS